MSFELGLKSRQIPQMAFHAVVGKKARGKNQLANINPPTCHSI
jgi:hypothetical protein